MPNPTQIIVSLSNPVTSGSSVNFTYTVSPSSSAGQKPGEVRVTEASIITYQLDNTCGGWTFIGAIISENDQKNAINDVSYSVPNGQKSLIVNNSDNDTGNVCFSFVLFNNGIYNTPDPDEDNIGR